MAWRQFTKWIPNDGLIIAKTKIPQSVIESWQVWLNGRGYQTKIETKNEKRALFVFDDLEDSMKDEGGNDGTEN